MGNIINMNMIDIKYATSNEFNIAKLPHNDDGSLKYGFKKIAIVNYIIGICKSNINKCKKRNAQKHPVLNFYNNAKNKKVYLDADCSNIKYKTIANKCKCSFELVKKVTQWLIENNVLTHEQYYFIDPNTERKIKTNIWFYKIVCDKFVHIYKKLRRICENPEYQYISYNEKKRNKLMLEKFKIKLQEEKELRNKKAEEAIKQIEKLANKKYSLMSVQERFSWIEKLNSK